MSGPKRSTVSEKQVQGISKALADPTRYEILKRIGRCRDGLACEAVRDCLKISAPNLSHHMKELETAGLITAERRGRLIHYRVRSEVLERFFNRLKEDLKC